MNEEIKRRIDSMKDVPAMPNVVIKALDVVKNPNSSIKELGDIITFDQSLSIKVLNIVNSAYYGFAQQINSISRALALLGLNRTKNLIITVAMKPMFSSEKNKKLWEHSILAAVGCEFLAEHLNIRDCDEAFVIGFMHDIGKIILNMQDKDILAKIQEFVDDGSDVLETEDAFLQTNHSEVGAALAKKWQLPILLTNVIKYHHNPAKSSVPVECSLVYLVDKLIQDKFNPDSIKEEYYQALNITLDRPDILRDSILKRATSLLGELAK